MNCLVEIIIQLSEESLTHLQQTMKKCIKVSVSSINVGAFDLYELRVFSYIMFFVSKALFTHPTNCFEMLNSLQIKRREILNRSQS